MSFNPVPENLKKNKILDLYFGELLAEQDKYICLNQEKTVSNLQQRIAFVYEPSQLGQQWRLKRSLIFQMKGKLTPCLKYQNSSTKLFYFLDRL